MEYKYSIIAVILCLSLSAFSQRYKSVEKQLDSLSIIVPALEDPIDISVNGVSIQEFTRAIATANKVNISINPNLNFEIVNNFSKVPLKDILLFLVKEYDLELEFIGNIISIDAYSPPVVAQKKIERQLKIQFRNNLLTVDLNNDSLVSVCKKITQLTGVNIITGPGLGNTLINGYIQNLPIETAMEQIAIANNLNIDNSGNGIITIFKSTEESNNGTIPKRKLAKGSKPNSNNNNNDYYILNVTSNGNLINIEALNAPIDSIVEHICEQQNINFQKLSNLESSVTLFANSLTLRECFDFIFNASEYHYKAIDNVYIFGNKTETSLEQSKLIQLQYRTVENLQEFLPSFIKNNLEIIIIEELNSLLVSGSESSINEFEQLIREIDKLVPVVLIEILIIEVKKEISSSFGLAAGLSKEEVTSSGKIYPALDLTLNGEQTNKLIDNLASSLNGLGWLNIGKVTKDFYLSLTALEDNKFIKIRSTPKLSTLNGHEASLTVGETKYYSEDKSSIISTQSIAQTNTRTYKPINADLSIKIKPIVSGDDQITLHVEVSLSDFTSPGQAGEPPGSLNRDFTSTIRVKNEDMVLLGGLESKNTNNSGSGTPVLSRIPVLRWFFSSRKKSNNDSKLNIFIKPTVIN